MHVGSPALAVLGFGGGLLHVVNHAVFKGLLFLGAGAVLHSARTRTIEELGGLLGRMPWTGIAFLTGAVAVAGLPPLNGFASEFLIYLGAFEGATSLGNAGAVPALVVIAGLAMIGGLAAACFTKAFGVAFLREPRSEHAAHAREVGPARRLPGGRPVGEVVAGDGGYLQPSPRMQYTASSFAQPLTDLFGLLLGTRQRLSRPEGFFPEAASLSTETPDICRERVYRPIFSGL